METYEITSFIFILSLIATAAAQQHIADQIQNAGSDNQQEPSN